MRRATKSRCVNGIKGPHKPDATRINLSPLRLSPKIASADQARFFTRHDLGVKQSQNKNGGYRGGVVVAFVGS